MIFADIIVDISVKSLDRTFQYKVPPGMEKDTRIGSLVQVPFWKRQQTPLKDML